MLSLSGKKCCRGRRQPRCRPPGCRAAFRDGARVLAVARQEGSLQQLAREVAGVEVLSLDASDEGAPSKIFGILQPDILVLGGGAFPPAAPLHEQTWQQFAVNWEADVRSPFISARQRCRGRCRRGHRLF